MHRCLLQAAPGPLLGAIKKRRGRPGKGARGLISPNTLPTLNCLVWAKSAETILAKLDRCLFPSSQCTSFEGVGLDLSSFWPGLSSLRESRHPLFTRLNVTKALWPPVGFVAVPTDGGRLSAEAVRFCRIRKTTTGHCCQIFFPDTRRETKLGADTVNGD